MKILAEIAQMILRLNNWRCFQASKIELPNYPLVLCDQNGSGKTSILAAVYGLLTGNPWPLSKFSSCLMAGQDYFGISEEHHPNSWFLSGKISPSGRLVMRYEKPPRLGSAVFGEAVVEALAGRHAETESAVPTVVVTKTTDTGQSYLQDKHYLQDVQVLTYLPSDNGWLFAGRRDKLRILDELLGQIFGDGYRQAVKKLNQVNLQKLRVIKHSRQQNRPVDEVLLRTLSQQIYRYSTEIWQQRLRFLRYLSDHLPRFESWIATDLTGWQVRWETTDGYGRRQMVQNWQIDTTEPVWPSIWQQELASEKLLYGAHRDDFNLVNRHLICQEVFSRGEMRSLVLFLKNLAQDLSAKVPTIWLMDDVFNELDGKREQIVFQQILSRATWFVVSATERIPDLPIVHWQIRDCLRS